MVSYYHESKIRERNRIAHNDRIKNALIIIFLSMFCVTFVITILGITKIVSIDDFYLKGLFSALILELVSSVLVLFRSIKLTSSPSEEGGLSAMGEGMGDQRRNDFQEKEISELSDNMLKILDCVDRFSPLQPQDINRVISSILKGLRLHSYDLPDDLMGELRGEIEGNIVYRLKHLEEMKLCSKELLPVKGSTGGQVTTSYELTEKGRELTANYRERKRQNE